MEIKEAKRNIYLYSIIACLLMGIVIIVTIVSIPKTSISSLLKDDDYGYKMTINDYELRNFENIYTKLFQFRNKKTGEPCVFGNGDIKLKDLTDTVNKYLDTLEYEPVGIGIVNDQLYIMYDETKKCNKKLKTNILSFAVNIDENDLIKALELVHKESHVYSACFLYNKTDAGNKHYLYIYSEK